MKSVKAFIVFFWTIMTLSFCSVVTAGSLTVEINNNVTPNDLYFPTVVTSSSACYPSIFSYKNNRDPIELPLGDSSLTYNHFLDTGFCINRVGTNLGIITVSFSNPNGFKPITSSVVGPFDSNQFIYCRAKNGLKKHTFTVTCSK